MLNGPKIAAVLGLIMNIPMWAHISLTASVGWAIAAILVTKFVPSR